MKKEKKFDAQKIYVMLPSESDDIKAYQTHLKRQGVSRKNVHLVVDYCIQIGDFNQALDLIYRYRVKGYTLTQSSVKKEYKFKPKQFEQLAVLEVKNPHYSTSAPMRLYLKSQVETIASPPK